MKDKPKMTGGRGDTIWDQLRNEFLDKDSLLNQKTGTVGYEITNKESKMNQDLAKAFDVKNLENAVKSIKDAFDKIDYRKIDQDAKNALDPKLNGIDAAFQRAGGDAKKALDDIANKIKQSAEQSGDLLKEGLSRLKNEFENPNSDLSVFFKDLGVDITENYLKNPDFWFDVVSVILVGASFVITAPIGGVGAPVAFAAMQAMVAGAKMLSHAAQGKQITAGEVAGFLLCVIPATGIANQVGSKVAKAGAPNVGALLDSILVAQPAASLAGMTFLQKANTIGTAMSVKAATFGGSATAASGANVASKTLPAEVLVAQSLAADDQVGRTPATGPPGSQTNVPAGYVADGPAPGFTPPPAYSMVALLANENDVAREIAQSKAEQLKEEQAQNNEANLPHYDYEKGDYIYTVPGKLKDNEANVPNYDYEKGDLYNQDLQGKGMMTGGEGPDILGAFAALGTPGVKAPRGSRSHGNISEAFKFLTGGGMHGSGSELIEYAYTHALNKRPRLNYDPSFFC